MNRKKNLALSESEYLKKIHYRDTTSYLIACIMFILYLYIFKFYYSVNYTYSNILVIIFTVLINFSFLYLYTLFKNKFTRNDLNISVIFSLINGFFLFTYSLYSLSEHRKIGLLFAITSSIIPQLLKNLSSLW